MKNEKNYMANIANFEAFCWNISLSANLLFMKSARENETKIVKITHSAVAAHVVISYATPNFTAQVKRWAWKMRMKCGVASKKPRSGRAKHH